MFILSSCMPPPDNAEFTDRYESIKEKFYADPIVFYGTDTSKPRIDLAVEIPFENIFLVKNPSNQTYHSKLIITVTIKDLSGFTAVSETHTEESTFTKSEIKAKSENSQVYFYHYSVDPGEYITDIDVKDGYKEREYKKSCNITVKDNRNESVVLSDLMLLSKFEINPDGTKEITPLISNNISGIKELFVFFEIYNYTENEIIKNYTVKFKDNKGFTLKESNLSYSLLPGKNRKFENILIPADFREILPDEEPLEFNKNGKITPLKFMLEIIDKEYSTVASQKKLFFIPGKPKFKIKNRPPQQRQ
jgi:hypothetical protein